MPYIPQANRRKLEITWDRPDEVTILTSGEMNYLVTQLIDQWLGETPHYDDLNSAIGVLECAKQELYRRVVSLYEDQKCYENGDVYSSRHK